LQLLGSAERSDSQPFTGRESQSPNPTAQVMPHAPVSQKGVPLVASQTAAHAAQFAGSVCVFTSQPFARDASQSAKPASQVMPQVADVHVAVPFVALHALMQAPQCAGSVVRFTSQPSTFETLQSAKPSVQAISHTPALQLGAPFVALQATTQAPQWVGSLLRLISQPFEALPSQSPYPELQEMPHTPAPHDAVPFVESQAVPHVPQCAVSAWRFTSHPLDALPSQSP
jgi:hypothetical protein